MSPKKNAGPIQFPCTFPLKVIGRNVAGFETTVLAVLNRHIPGIGAEAVRSQPSRENKFLAVTITFTAHSREQVEAIYQDLNRVDEVVMTL